MVHLTDGENRLELCIVASDPPCRRHYAPSPDDDCESLGAMSKEAVPHVLAGTPHLLGPVGGNKCLLCASSLHYDTSHFPAR